MLPHQFQGALCTVEASTSLLVAMGTVEASTSLLVANRWSCLGKPFSPWGLVQQQERSCVDRRGLRTHSSEHGHRQGQGYGARAVVTAPFESCGRGCNRAPHVGRGGVGGGGGHVSPKMLQHATLPILQIAIHFLLTSHRYT